MTLFLTGKCFEEKAQLPTFVILDSIQFIEERGQEISISNLQNLAGRPCLCQIRFQ